MCGGSVRLILTHPILQLIPFSPATSAPVPRHSPVDRPLSPSTNRPKPASTCLAERRPYRITRGSVDSCGWDDRRSHSLASKLVERGRLYWSSLVCLQERQCRQCCCDIHHDCISNWRLVQDSLLGGIQDLRARSCHLPLECLTVPVVEAGWSLDCFARDFIIVPHLLLTALRLR